MAPPEDPSPTPTPMSLLSRLLNVFAAPGELFTHLAASPYRVTNWLVPATLVGLVGLIVNLAIFSNPALVQQVRDLQERELATRVEKGTMRAEDADRAREVMGGIGMTIAKVGGGVAAVLGGLLMPFWWGFLCWLIGRAIFRTPMGYLRGVEVAALASLVAALGLIVTLFLSIGLGRLGAGAHLGMLVTEFDFHNRLHLALAAINAFSLWHLGLLALGTARLLGRPALPVALVFLGLWLGYKSIAVALGIAQFAM